MWIQAKVVSSSSIRSAYHSLEGINVICILPIDLYNRASVGGYIEAHMAAEIKWRRMIKVWQIAYCLSCKRWAPNRLNVITT